MNLSLIWVWDMLWEENLQHLLAFHHRGQSGSGTGNSLHTSVFPNTSHFSNAAYSCPLSVILAVASVKWRLLSLWPSVYMRRNFTVYSWLNIHRSIQSKHKRDGICIFNSRSMSMEDLGQEILQAGAHFKNLNVDGRMILKRILGDVELDAMKWI